MYMAVNQLTCLLNLENLEVSGNLAAVREKWGNWPELR